MFNAKIVADIDKAVFVGNCLCGGWQLEIPLTAGEVEARKQINRAFLMHFATCPMPSRRARLIEELRKTPPLLR